MASSGLSQQIDLRISCTDLPNMDMLSKTDCCVFVYEVEPGVKQAGRAMSNEKLLGQTETVKDSLNPVFSTGVKVNFQFETEQLLRFMLLDIDKPGGKITDQDYIGIAEIKLGAIVGARGQTVTLPIIKNPSGKKQMGKASIKIVAEELAQSIAHVQMTMSAKVPKKGLLSKPDPFVQIFRTREDKQEVAVFTSGKVKNSTEPVWTFPLLSASDLANGDLDRMLQVKFYDWESNGSHIYIGQFGASINEMTTTANSGSKQFQLKVQKGKVIGGVTINSCQIKNKHTLMSYLKAGVQLNLNVAIDFTASNGDPNTPQSLHFRSPNGPNQYQQALQWVGGILQDYDHDKMFPVYGFGAKLPDGTVTHCWALNGNPQRPECPGMPAVMDAYSLALSHVQLYGPTNFAPIINNMCNVVQASSNAQEKNLNYQVLLFMTDGAITDMDATIRAICAAARLPISIIIVGVGNYEFNEMKQLDGDGAPLTDSAGNPVYRDIVQFVSMKSCHNNDPSVMQRQLARELLAELPAQVIDYYTKVGYNP